jgi:hypothetical protein
MDGDLPTSIHAPTIAVRGSLNIGSRTFIQKSSTVGLARRKTVIIVSRGTAEVDASSPQSSERAGFPEL